MPGSERRIPIEHHTDPFERMLDQSEVRAKQLARDVLSMAYDGRMPDTYWLTDQRIARAASVLGKTPEEARRALDDS